MRPTHRQIPALELAGEVGLLSERNLWGLRQFLHGLAVHRRALLAAVLLLLLVVIQPAGDAVAAAGPAAPEIAPTHPPPVPPYACTTWSQIPFAVNPMSTYN